MRTGLSRILFATGTVFALAGGRVSSVNKGLVLLSGKTKSLASHLEPVEVANAVPGVRRVSTEVEVEPGS
jgi:hypothetical protein